MVLTSCKQLSEPQVWGIQVVIMHCVANHLCETSLLPQAALKLAVPRDFILKKSKVASLAWNQFCFVWDPARNKEVYGIVSYQNFSTSFCITFKENSIELYQSTMGQQV